MRAAVRCNVLQPLSFASRQPARVLISNVHSASTPNSTESVGKNPASKSEEPVLASAGGSGDSQKNVAKRKTVSELDEELRLKLEGISGEGGSSGVEYENGKASGLKRSVKENMFRVI